MTTKTDKLKPCPFCGGTAHFSRSDDLVNVRCEGWNPGKCLGAGPNCYTETDAAARWNRRAALRSQDPSDPTLPHEQALAELVDKIIPCLDTGDLLADAKQASSALQSQDREDAVPIRVVSNAAHGILGTAQYERFMEAIDAARAKQEAR